MPPPNDEVHSRLSQGLKYPVLPKPVTTENNAFFHGGGVLEPVQHLSGDADKSLVDVLGEFAAKTGDDLCYWSFQGLAAARGGPTLLHPLRGYWDLSDGHLDQDMEWVQALGEVAVSRLHSRIKPDGPLVGTMCSMGNRVMNRRCENGRANQDPAQPKCIPAITNVTNGGITWPMSVSIWKVGHPEWKAAMTDWRGGGMNNHVPNIEWVAHIKEMGIKAFPWNGSMPKPGELNPSNMPQGPKWPVAENPGWGSPKIAKVVKCADIPSKFKYHKKQFYCDSMSSPTAEMSDANEAYAVWRSLEGVWPPTKPCKDDLEALDELLKKTVPWLVGSNCSVAYGAVQKLMPNFDCDNSYFVPSIRDMCCSICGNKTIPQVIYPPPSPPPTQASHKCAICDHVYDAEKDGNGTAFEDLPDSWVCPVCGAPKSAYTQMLPNVWAHKEIVI